MELEKVKATTPLLARTSALLQHGCPETRIAWPTGPSPVTLFSTAALKTRSWAREPSSRSGSAIGLTEIHQAPLRRASCIGVPEGVVQDAQHFLSVGERETPVRTAAGLLLSSARRSLDRSSSRFRVPSSALCCRRSRRCSCYLLRTEAGVADKNWAKILHRGPRKSRVKPTRVRSVLPLGSRDAFHTGTYLHSVFRRKYPTSDICQVSTRLDTAAVARSLPQTLPSGHPATRLSSGERTTNTLRPRVALHPAAAEWTVARNRPSPRQDLLVFPLPNSMLSSFSPP